MKIKELFWGGLLFAAFCLVGTMDYQDEVLQHSVNCQSATYVFDNNLECGE
jgi:hypothetical protein